MTDTLLNIADKWLEAWGDGDDAHPDDVTLVRALYARVRELEAKLASAEADVDRVEAERDHYRDCISAREVRALVDERDALRAALRHLLNADRIRPDDCPECANAQTLAYFAVPERKEKP